MRLPMRSRDEIEAPLTAILIGLTLHLLAPTADCAEPPGSAKEILQLALDAQLTREAQWKQGKMDVTMKKTGVGPMSAEFSLAWSDDGVYMDLRQHRSTSLSVEGKLHEEEREPRREIFTAKEEWGYIPSLAAGFGVGPGKMRKFRGELDVRPATAWGTFPGVPQVRLSKLLRRAIDKDADGEVSQVEGGVTRVDSKTGHVWFIDVPAGGDLVRFEHNMHEGVEVKPGIDPGMRTATYEWARDAHGVPYCRKFRAEYFRPDDRTNPGLIHEVEVTSYNSRLSKEEARFDLARLEIPKGTKMSFAGPDKSRSWRHGVSDSESKLLQQPDFERLINETKESGFAAPKDE
jgi:hypothetical protein